jgi:hypothetical protein
MISLKPAIEPPRRFDATQQQGAAIGTFTKQVISRFAPNGCPVAPWRRGGSASAVLGDQ